MPKTTIEQKTFYICSDCEIRVRLGFYEAQRLGWKWERSGCNLHIHHKDFDASNNSPDNAQVVCGDCHIQLHKGVAETEWDQFMAEVRRKDLETEQEMKDAWGESDRVLNRSVPNCL